jgi:23S rRNA pseudouridine1911/1915/1917 synthase
MLHAWRLGFEHPESGRRMNFFAAVPPEFTPWLPPGWNRSEA